MATKVKKRTLKLICREWQEPSVKRVDTKAGVIYDVRIMGKHSKNRREYTDHALDQGVEMCEGAKVYVDHALLGRKLTPKEQKARSMFAWAGVVENCRRTDDGVRGNIRYLKSSPGGQLLEEAAQKFPEKFGLSQHNVCEGWVRDSDGVSVIERLLEIKSIDVVDKPATVNSLFEAEMDETPAVAPPPSIEEAFLMLQNAVMASTDHDDTERIAVLKDVMKLKGKILGGGEEEAPAADDAPAETSESVETPSNKAIHAYGAGVPKTGLRRELREVKVRQMILAEGVQVEDSVIAGMVDMTDDALKSLITSLKKQQRPRYGERAPARVGGRREAQESIADNTPKFTTTDRKKLFLELQD